MNKRSQSAVVGSFKQHSFTLSKGPQGGRGGGQGSRGRGGGRYGSEEENPEDALPSTKEELQAKVDDFYRLPPQTIPLIEKRNYSNFMYGAEQRQQQQQQWREQQQQQQWSSANDNTAACSASNRGGQQRDSTSRSGAGGAAHQNNYNQSHYNQNHQASYEVAPPTIENTFYQNGAVLELCKIVQVAESFNLLRSAPASMAVDTAPTPAAEDPATGDNAKGSNNSPKKKYGGDNDSVTVMIRSLSSTATVPAAPDGGDSVRPQQQHLTGTFDVEVQVFDPCRPYSLLGACRGWLVSNLLVEAPSMSAPNTAAQHTSRREAHQQPGDDANADPRQRIGMLRREVQTLLNEVESLHTIGWSSHLLQHQPTGHEASDGTDGESPAVASNHLYLHHGMSIRVLATLLGALKPIAPSISTRLSSPLMAGSEDASTAESQPANSSGGRRQFGNRQPQLEPVTHAESEAVVGAVLDQLRSALSANNEDNSHQQVPPNHTTTNGTAISKEEKERNRNLFIIEKVAELQKDMFSLKMSAMYACLARAQYMVALEGRMKALCDRVEALAEALGVVPPESNTDAHAAEGVGDEETNGGSNYSTNQPCAASADLIEEFRAELRPALTELQAFYRQLRLFFIREVPHFNRVLTAADTLDRETAKRMSDLLTCYSATTNCLATVVSSSAALSSIRSGGDAASEVDGDGEFGDEAGEAMLKVNKEEFLNRLAGGSIASAKLVQYHNSNTNPRGRAAATAPAHYPFFTLERAALIAGLFSTCGRYAKFVTSSGPRGGHGSTVPFTLVPLQLSSPTAAHQKRPGCTAAAVEFAAFNVLATRVYTAAFVSFLRYQLPRAILHSVMLFHKDGGARWLADYSSSHYSSLFENYASICAGDRRVDVLLEGKCFRDKPVPSPHGVADTRISPNNGSVSQYDYDVSNSALRGLSASEWGQLLVQLFGPNKPHYPPLVSAIQQEDFLAGNVASIEKKVTPTLPTGAAVPTADEDALDDNGEPLAAKPKPTPQDGDDDDDAVSTAASSEEVLDRNFRELGAASFARAIQQYYLSVYGVRSIGSSTPVDCDEKSPRTDLDAVVASVLTTHQVVILTGVGDVDALRGRDNTRRLQQVFSNLNATVGTGAGAIARGGASFRDRHKATPPTATVVAPTASTANVSTVVTTEHIDNNNNNDDTGAAVKKLLKSRITWVASGFSGNSPQQQQHTGREVTGALASQLAQRQLQRQSKGIALLHDQCVKALLAEWFVYTTDAAPLLADKVIPDVGEDGDPEDDDGLTIDEMMRDEINERILATHPVLSQAATTRILGAGAAAALPQLATLTPVTQLYTAVFPTLIGPALLSLLHTDKGPLQGAPSSHHGGGQTESASVQASPQTIGTLLETLVFLFLNNNTGARAVTAASGSHSASPPPQPSSSGFSRVDRLYAVILEAILKTLVASAASGYKSLRDVRKLIGGITTILFASSSSVALNAASIAQAIEADLVTGGAYQQNAARDLVHLVDPAELQQLLTVLRPKLFQLFEYYSVGHLVHIPSLEMGLATVKKATVADRSSTEEGCEAPSPAELLPVGETGKGGEVCPEAVTYQRLDPQQVRLLWRQGTQVTAAAQEITVLCGSLTKLHQHLQRAMPFAQVALDSRRTMLPTPTSITEAQVTSHHEDDSGKKRFKRLVSDEDENTAPLSRRRRSKGGSATPEMVDDGMDVVGTVSQPIPVLAAAVTISSIEQDASAALTSLLNVYPALLTLPPLQQPNKPLTLDVVRLFVERYVYLHTAALAVPSVDTTSVLSEATTGDVRQRTGHIVEALNRLQQFTSLAPSQQVVGASLMGFVSVVSRLIEGVVTQELRVLEQIYSQAGSDVANIIASLVSAAAPSSPKGVSDAAVKSAQQTAYRRLVGMYFVDGANRDEALRDLFPVFHSDAVPLLTLVGVSVIIKGPADAASTPSDRRVDLADTVPTGGIPFPSSRGHNELDTLLEGSPSNQIQTVNGASKSSVEHQVFVSGSPQRVAGSVLGRFFTLQLRRVCAASQLARMERVLASPHTPNALLDTAGIDAPSASSSAAVLRLFTNQPGTDAMTSTMTLLTSLLQVIQGSKQLIRAVSSAEAPETRAAISAMVEGLLGNELLTRHIIPVLGEVVVVSQESVANTLTTKVEEKTVGASTAGGKKPSNAVAELFLFPNIYSNFNARKQLRDVRAALEGVLEALSDSTPSAAALRSTLEMVVRSLARSPTTAIQILTKDGILLGKNEATANEGHSGEGPSPHTMVVAGPNGGTISFSDISGAAGGPGMKSSADATGYAASSFAGSDVFEAVDRTVIGRLSGVGTTSTAALIAPTEDGAATSQDVPATSMADRGEASSTAARVPRRGVFFHPQYQDLSASEVGELARRLQGRIRMLSAGHQPRAGGTSSVPMGLSESPAATSDDPNVGITGEDVDAPVAAADSVDSTPPTPAVPLTAVDEVEDAAEEGMLAAAALGGESTASKLRSAARSVATLLTFASFYTSGVQSPLSSILMVLEDAERALLDPATPNSNLVSSLELLKPSMIVVEFFARSLPGSFVPKATFKVRDTVAMLHALFICGDAGALTTSCFPGHCQASETTVDLTSLDEQRFRLCTQLLRLKAEQQFMETCVFPLMAIQALPFTVKLSFSASRILERQKAAIDEMYDLITSAPGADKALRLSPSDCHNLYAALAKVHAQLFATLASRCDEKLRIENHHLQAIQANAHAQRLQLEELQSLLGDRDGINGMTAAARHEVTSTSSILRASIGSLSTDAESASQRLLSPLSTVLQVCAKAKQVMGSIRVQQAIIEGSAAVTSVGPEGVGETPAIDDIGGEDNSTLADAAATMATPRALDSGTEEFAASVHCLAESVCDTIASVVNIQHSVRALSTDSNDVVARSSSLLGSASAFFHRGGMAGTTVLVESIKDSSVLPSIQAHLAPFSTVVGPSSLLNPTGPKSPTDIPTSIAGGVPSMLVSDDVISRLSLYDKLGRALFPSMLNHLRDLNHRHMGLLYALLPDIQRFATPQGVANASSPQHEQQLPNAVAKTKAQSVVGMPLFTPAQFFLLLRAYSSLGVWNNRAMGPICEGLLQVYVSTSHQQRPQGTTTLLEDGTSTTTTPPLPALLEAVSSFATSVTLLLNLKRSNFVPSSFHVNLLSPAPSDGMGTTQPAPEYNEDGDDESKGYDGKFIYRDEEGSVVERLVEHTIRNMFAVYSVQVQPHLDRHMKQHSLAIASRKHEADLLPTREASAALCRSAATAVGCLGHLSLPPEPLFSSLVDVSIRSLRRDVRHERTLRSTLADDGNTAALTSPDVAPTAMPSLVRAILTGKLASPTVTEMSSAQARFNALVVCLEYYDLFITTDVLASTFPMHSQALVKAIADVLLFASSRGTITQKSESEPVGVDPSALSASVALALLLLTKVCKAGVKKHLQRCPHLFFADFVKEVFGCYAIAASTAIASATDLQRLLTSMTEALATGMIYNKRIFTITPPESLIADVTLDDLTIQLGAAGKQEGVQGGRSSPPSSSSVPLSVALLTIPSVSIGVVEDSVTVSKWPLPAKALLADTLSVAWAAVNHLAMASDVAPPSVTNFETALSLKRTTQLLSEALLYDILVDCTHSLSGSSGASVVSGPIAASYMGFAAVAATCGTTAPISDGGHSSPSPKVIVRGSQISWGELTGSNPAKAAALGVPTLLDPSFIVSRVLVATARCAALRQKAIQWEGCYRLLLATELLKIPAPETPPLATGEGAGIPPASVGDDVKCTGVSGETLSKVASVISQSDASAKAVVISESSQLSIEASRLAVYSAQRIQVVPPSTSMDAPRWSSLLSTSLQTNYVRTALMMLPATAAAVPPLVAEAARTLLRTISCGEEEAVCYRHPTLWDVDALSKFIQSTTASSAIPKPAVKELIARELGLSTTFWDVVVALKMKRGEETQSLNAVAAAMVANPSPHSASRAAVDRIDTTADEPPVPSPSDEAAPPHNPPPTHSAPTLSFEEVIGALISKREAELKARDAAKRNKKRKETSGRGKTPKQEHRNPSSKAEAKTPVPSMGKKRKQGAATSGKSSAIDKIKATRKKAEPNRKPRASSTSAAKKPKS